jgi:Skp family chaperone for outer membrane proteins
MTQRFSWIALAVLALFTVGSWMVEAAQAQNPAFSLAFVDLRRLSSEYEGTKQSQTELNAFQQTLRKQLDDLEAIRFLDDKERGEVATLRAVASPTPEQKKRLDDLLAASKARGDQLRALQQNPNKTDAEKADFDRLSQLSNKTDDEMETLGTQLDDQLTAKSAELSKKLTDTVLAAITDIAKQKAYTVVMDKQAVLYGGTDLTDDVMKKLSGK